MAAITICSDCWVQENRDESNGAARGQGSTNEGTSVGVSQNPGLGAVPGENTSHLCRELGYSVRKVLELDQECLNGKRWVLQNLDLEGKQIALYPASTGYFLCYIWLSHITSLCLSFQRYKMRAVTNLIIGILVLVIITLRLIIKLCIIINIFRVYFSK